MTPGTTADEHVHEERIREAQQAIEERIEDVEEQKHLDLPNADVRTNAPRALMQAGGKGEKRGLEFAYGLLEDL